MASAAVIAPVAVVEPNGFEVVVPPQMTDPGEFLKFVDEDLEEEEVEEEIVPAYYSDGTKIPVFTPVSCCCCYCRVGASGVDGGAVVLTGSRQWISFEASRSSSTISTITE